MKITKYISLLLLVILTTSCEKVIDVDLETATPRLVVDASIKWTKETSGNQQMIKLSTTTGYFSTTIPPVSGAIVTVKNSTNEAFTFIEKTGTSEYICSNFSPKLNENYTLTIVYKGETYQASESLKPVPIIDRIVQKDNGGFTAKEIEIKAFYTDNKETNDFYLSRLKPSFVSIPTYGVGEDKYIQGNESFILYTHENLKKGQNIDISLHGISERYYNYMLILLSIAGSNGGSPFQSPPSTVRGNVINQTNEANYPLGYFSLSEVASQNYLVQ